MLARAKPFIIVLIAITLHFDGFAQKAVQEYDPKILILSPARAVVAPVLQKEVIAQNAAVSKMAEQAKAQAADASKQLADKPQNIKLMVQNNQAYLNHLDFFKQISFLTNSYLTYSFFERFPNELILLKDTVVATGVESMQRLANREQMPYIISFPKVELAYNNGEKKLKMTIQLYEQSSNSYIVNDEYTGDDRNHGFEFTCEDKSLGCTLNNALSVALKKVITQIADNNPTIIRQRQLAGERATALQDKLFNAPYDVSLVKQVISPTDSSINLQKIYQCLYNADKTKFVAFFAENKVTNQFKTLHDKTDKGMVNIITSKNIGDPGYLDSIPSTYAYIVKGVFYKGKWYYQKDHITYFDAPTVKDGELMYLNNLGDWDYFKTNTSEYSTAFWDGKLFEKVPDRKKDPEWEKYKGMWEREERENRDYIGLYTIVAQQMMKEKKDDADDFKTRLLAGVLQPYFDAQVKNKKNNVVKYDPYSLIYPKDRHVVIDPVLVTNSKGERSIYYFVVIPGSKQIFEWTYFKPYLLPAKDYGDDPINKMMGSVTKWTFAYDTLEDDNFWNNCVLLKEGSGYKYLRPLN